MMLKLALICLLVASTGCAGQLCCIRTYISSQRIFTTEVEIASDGQVVGQTSRVENRTKTVQRIEFFCKLPSSFKEFGPKEAAPDPEARGRLTSR